MDQITTTSWLAAPPATVWARIATMDGVNAELSPWLRMTAPAAYRSTPFDAVPLPPPVAGHPTVLLRSTLLALGVVPIDVHALALATVTRDRGFEERSTSWLEAAWHHDRTLTPSRGGTVLEDRVAFRPRVPGARWIVAPIVAALFRHRHRGLRAVYGGEDQGQVTGNVVAP